MFKQAESIPDRGRQCTVEGIIQAECLARHLHKTGSGNNEVVVVVVPLQSTSAFQTPFLDI